MQEMQIHKKICSGLPKIIEFLTWCSQKFDEKLIKIKNSEALYRSSALALRSLRFWNFLRRLKL
jgi:hypothetical protein